MRANPWYYWVFALLRVIWTDKNYCYFRHENSRKKRQKTVLNGANGCLLILVWFKRNRLREWKGETHFRFFLSFVMFVMEFSFFCRLLYVGDDSGNHLMMSKLPLHVCDLGLICCMYMVPSKNRTLFGINFFITLFGATLACIIPQTVLTNAGPAHYRYPIIKLNNKLNLPF